MHALSLTSTFQLAIPRYFTVRPFVGALLGAFIYEAFSRPFMPGVVKHGYTPFMLAWNDLLLRIAPSLQADDEEEAEDEQDVKRQQRHHIRPEMWSPYNVG